MLLADISSKNNTLKSILLLIETFANNEDSWAALTVLWDKMSKLELPVDALTVYAQKLPLFKITYKVIPLVTDDIQHQDREPVSELISLINQNVNLAKELSSRYADKYSFYQSSLELADVLREVYTEDFDPGKIIGDYLKLFFPDVNTQSPLPTKDKVSIIHGSEIHRLLFNIGLSCIEATVPDNQQRACLKLALQNFFDLKEEAQSTNELPFEDVLRAVIFAPEGLFQSWAHEWWLSDENDNNIAPKISTATLKTLFQHATLQADCLHGGNGKRPIITLDLLNMLFFKLIEDGSLTYDSELEGYFAEIHSFYSQIRKKKYYGVSPLDYLASSDLCRTLEYEGYPISICDLTTILGTGFLVAGDTYLGPPDNGDSLTPGYDDKEVAYLILFEKAVNEGFPELGNALVSLYLIARAFCCRCRFVPDNKLYSVIATGLSLPGASVLKKTLEIIVSWVDDYLASDTAAMLSGRFFKQFLPQKASLYAIQGGGKEPEKRPAEEVDVEAFLVNQLGLERWMKLCDESKNQLKTAQTLWRKGFVEFGFGITDCSGLISNYNKVIEKEVVDRLETFYFSPQYQSFFYQKTGKKPDKKPTMGTLVRELLDYQKLPADLRKLMDDSRLTVHHNRDLVKDLQKIVAFRNQSAHKDQFDIVEFSKFKKIYFQDRLIHRFIDCLL